MSTLLAGGLTSPVLATFVFMLATLCLALVALGGPTSARKTGIVVLPYALLAIMIVLADGPSVLLVALAFSGLGEMLLVQQQVTASLLALGAFLAARVVYAVVFTVAGTPGMLLEGWRLATAIVLALATVLVFVRICRRRTALNIPEAIYGLVLVAMVATAGMVTPPTVMGGALILAAADLSHALHRYFVKRDSSVGLAQTRVIWLARFAGQVVIVFVALGLIR
ncbi:lysoplasmalogenase family protein [Pararhizobium mangrovi]|uniref:Lysoplasmalogenase n=1 Tax=Pararhizobium mangrovi TaxID=2590452 RepID=A0A506U1D0_9HYPH|nr:lysoplasmalogenase family protein [Pararhizobium mangrovi]TPW27308.1 hypothetical protein FJU11_12205 [Pararhizobium mangrovi]